MRKRINTPQLVVIATTDGTHFTFPQAKETVEKAKRKSKFFRRKLS